MTCMVRQLRPLARAGMALALVVAGCASSGNDGASGEGGGTAGEGGGTSANGGGAEAGSSGARGGTTGMAGVTAAGGSGAAGTGGSMGEGGSTGDAGKTGFGGSAGNGASGRGGATTGGRGGTGAAGRGGTSGSGGNAAGAGGGPSPDAGSADGGMDYDPCPTTAGTACSILPLGDSITEGCCTAPEGGYRIELFTKAVNSKQTITFVGGTLGVGNAKPNGPTTVAGKTFPQGNEGNGGYTIASPSSKGGIAGAITDQSLSMYKPNIVLLMIGTNDVLQNLDLGNAPTRLASLIDEVIAGAPNALLVVSSIPPCCNDATVQAYNATIPAMVKTRAQAGKHVLFVDAHAAFIKNANYKADYISSDGLHPSPNGYAVIGDLFYGAISQFLR
jgi:lysophospholipase L1-like esterase